MNFNPQEEDSIMVGCTRVALSLRMMKTFEADTAMVQVAVSSPTVPNRVTQVVPLAELCSLILATWVIVYCVHMLMVRSQEGPYCNTIIVTSSKTVPLLCLCLEWGKEFILDQV